MTPQEKKELNFVLKTATQVALVIAIIFFGLIILNTIL